MSNMILMAVVAEVYGEAFQTVFCQELFCLLLRLVSYLRLPEPSMLLVPVLAWQVALRREFTVISHHCP